MQKLVLGAFLGVEALLIGSVTTFHQELWSGLLDRAVVGEVDPAIAGSADDDLAGPDEISVLPQEPLVPVVASGPQNRISGMILFAFDRGALDGDALDALDFLAGRAAAAGGEVHVVLTGLGGLPLAGAVAPQRWSEGPVHVGFPGQGLDPAAPAGDTGPSLRGRRIEITAAAAASL